MNLSNNRIGTSFIIVFLLVIILIIVLPWIGLCVNPSPVINATPVENVAMYTNITVTGQNFTPNGIAVLYLPDQTYVSYVDKNGNVNWSIKKTLPGWYQIYALDENSTSRKSNAIMIYPLLNDATLTYTPTPSPISVTSSPVISASPNPAFYGQNITISGQHFTQNKKAFLYQIDVYNGNTSWSKESGYTADVDKNGNALWIVMEPVPYPGMIPNTTTIYAQDVSIVGNRSNTITLTLLVNPCITPIPVIPEPTETFSPVSVIPNVSDMPTPGTSPAFLMDTTIITLIAISAILLITGRSKKKR